VSDSFLNREELAVLGAVAVGITPFGVAFGVAAAAAGVSPVNATLMSMAVYAGASQFSAIAVLVAGGPPLLAVLTVWLVNLRFIPVGLAMPGSMTPTLPKRLIAAHLLVDPSIVLAHATTPERRNRLFWIVSLTLYGLWALGTVVGALAGAVIPDPGVLGLDAALPAMFVAILVPFWKDGPSRRAAIGGAGLAAAAVLVGLTPLAVPAGVLGAVAGLIERRR
jgi:4-azaleucine resistance transporter AzlC